MTTNEDIGEYKNWSEEFPNGGNSTWPYPGVVGLMLDYDGKDNESCPDCYTKDEYELVVSSTLMLVMFTTLIFGTFMDAVQKILIPPKPSAGQAVPDMQRHSS